MSGPQASAAWPSYETGPRENIFALGVISLNYAQLENIFRALFGRVAGMTPRQSRSIFGRTRNDVRQNITTDLLNDGDWPDDIKDAIRHFQAGFRILAGNRDALLHASRRVGYDNDDETTIVLGRTARTGGELISFASLPDLRAVADDMKHYAVWGAQLAASIDGYRLGLAHSPPPPWRPPLIEKPRLAVEVNWQPPPTRQFELPPPEPPQA